MPIYVDRSNAGICIYLVSLFCGRLPSLVFDGTCVYIVFNNLVNAVKLIAKYQRQHQHSRVLSVCNKDKMQVLLIYT